MCFLLALATKKRRSYYIEKYLATQLSKYSNNQSIRTAKLETIKLKAISSKCNLDFPQSKNFTYDHACSPIFHNFNTFFLSQRVGATWGSWSTTLTSLPRASRLSVIVFTSGFTDARRRPDSPSTKGSWPTADVRCGEIVSEGDACMMVCSMAH